MKENLKLYICNKEVEFTTGPKIVYNYKDTDLRNPTIVKNSYSKSIEIPGTESNNDLFGHIWNLERYQQDGGFNPMKKAPFELYVNGELIEKGYAKLDSIKRTDRAVSYSVHLYGGLGSFLYNLSYDESSDEDKKKTLADLHYYYYDGASGETQIGFTINKDTVLEAWEYIIGSGGIITDDQSHSPTHEYEDQWDVINFVPAYNGIPEDFSAGKVLVNHSGLTLQTDDMHLTQYVGNNGAVIGGTVYTAASNNGRGYSLYETKEDLTEWETKDLRSYLQRPAVNVRRTLDAIFMPENNGGWQVKLGSHFWNNDNPYCNDHVWMTLPLLKELDIKGEETEEVTGATAEKISSDRWEVNYGTIGGELNSARIRINPNMVAYGDTTMTANNYYSHFYWESTNGFTLLGSTYVDKLTAGGGVIIQMIARNANGDIVAQSKAYVLSNSQYAADGSTPINKYFWQEGDEGTQPEYEFISGHWHKSGSTYVYVDNRGYKRDIEFTLPMGMAITSIDFKVQMQNSEVVYYKFTGSRAESIRKGGTSNFVTLYPSDYEKGAYGLKTYAEVVQGRASGTLNIVVEDFYAVMTDYEAMFSDTYIPKEKLLNTPFTPGEFLLSYAKMFGLYFYCDPSEESDDPARYPNGVIHIMDRDDFFTDEVIDLEEFIDMSKDMTITPTLAESKFYNFEQEEVESEVNTDYANAYGHNYGRQLVNTGYNFDSNTNNLYDGNVFKSAVMVTEKDKYFVCQDGSGYQPFITQGGQQVLFGKTAATSTGAFNGETYTRTIDRGINSGANINFLGYEYYDLMPKMQFHTAENSPSDGAYVLCFYNHWSGIECESNGHYILSDDLPEMALYNDKEPCWLMSKTDHRYNNVRICWHIYRLPYFSRDIVAGQQLTGPIIHSWNFGHPKLTFSPEVYTTDGDCIYDALWKSYIRDLYNENGRKLSCYVNFEDRPNGGAMRKFYWFRNSIWRLNEVKDWNVFGYDSTLCEFIKVQDVDAYKLRKLYEETGWSKVSITPNVVPYTGAAVTINVELQDCGSWYIRTGTIRGYDEDGNSYEINPYPSGNIGCRSSITFTVPSTTATTDIRWHANIEFGDGHVEGYDFTQSKKPYATLSWPITPFDGYYKRFTINVTSNVDWTPISTATSWLTARKEGDSTLIIEAAANRGSSSRSGTIRLLYNGTSLAFKSLTQEPLE